MIRIGTCATALACALMIASACVRAEPATVQQPRAFGHVLGDIVTQQVLLGPDDRAAELSAMPSTAASTRGSNGAHRRSARMPTATAGSCSTTR